MPKLVATELTPEQFASLKESEVISRPPGAPTLPNQVPPEQHPSLGLDWISLLRVSWITPLILKGSASGVGQLTAEDVWPAPASFSAAATSAELHAAWASEQRDAASRGEGGRGEPPQLLNALYEAFWPRLFRAGGK